MNSILEISALSKNYGRIQAVDNLSLTVDEGSIYGILGPNGSGKTTTLAMILGAIFPDSGEYSWFGRAPSHQSRQNIGALLETPNFYPYLSAEQNLHIVADIKKIDRSSIEPVLKTVGLYERRKSPFRTYSLGMKQRLALASALLGDRDVLVLDEPTNGMDPQGIAEIREIILAVARQGKTIILASHILDEVEKTCTHVAVLKHGKLLADGPIADILRDDNIIEVGAENLATLQASLKAHPGVSSVDVNGAIVLATVQDYVTGAELNRYLAENGIYISHLSRRKKKLESQFLELVK